jgi:phosphatidate cytidylyltransferase
MGLDIKKFGIRAASAVIFVAVFLSAVLYHPITFSIFFGVVAIGALYEYFKIAEKLGFQPLKITGYLVAAIGYGFTVTQYNNMPYFWWLIAVVISLGGAVFQNHPQALMNGVMTALGLLYAVMPFSMVHQLVSLDGTFSPMLLLGIVLLIWSNDTFAYLGGSFFGKHKMIPRVSPGKTWEGTLIGIALTYASGILLDQWLFDGNGGVKWNVTVALTPFLATIGDLVESLFKRSAGVKDSGAIMPGHGGFLDRFDSLIFAAPTLIVVYKMLNL